ncbi:MAG: hypothetical protein LBD99_00120 [Candidatus Margulisbacteria bacterium]|jgi:tetratricopeptide (TPR) repeat protein|nr:hypothetical protein [Candidatus Margulisiibacteriota bacterium]
MQGKSIALRIKNIFVPRQDIVLRPRQTIDTAYISQEQIRGLLQRELIYAPYQSFDYLPPRAFYICSQGDIFNTDVELSEVQDLIQMLARLTRLSGRQTGIWRHYKNLAELKNLRKEMLKRYGQKRVLIYQIDYPEHYGQAGEEHIELEDLLGLYCSAQCPWAVKLIKARTPDAEMLADTLKKLEKRLRSAPPGQEILLKEIHYMLLARAGRFAGASRVLACLSGNNIQYDYDRAVLYYLSGDYARAASYFKAMLLTAEPSVKLPALFGLLRTCIRQKRPMLARQFFADMQKLIISPSPRAFPVLFLQVWDESAKLKEDVFTAAALPAEIVWRQPRDVFEYLAANYEPEIYFNRERPVLDVYIQLFRQDLPKMSGLPELKAAYIKHGFFNLHQLLQYLLRSKKYTERLLN